MEQLAPSPARQAASPTIVDVPSFAVPSLLFDNRTPFAATQFDTVDQHDAAFHVVAVKIGYTIGTCDDNGRAILTVLDEPAQLNTEDLHEAADAAASVLEESDYAPYKPRCDVIVNAVAYAPKKKPTGSLTARLSLAAAPANTTIPKALIDKTLFICGPRCFVKKPAVRRLAESAIRVATVGLVRPSPWRLSKAQPITHVPVRYEHALGGQCRIDSDNPAAKRVPEKHKLAGSQAPETPIAIAHEACESNPLGKGFARNWFLKAEKSKRIPAPQISRQGNDCTARDFVGGARGNALDAPAGFGAIGRAWLPRRALIGKIEEKASWSPDEVPRLPADFDYGYWNCAPADQQCDYLSGLEQFTLVNLCSPDSKSARTDQQGNTVLRFDLPQQAMLVLAATHNAQLTVLPLSLDTVVINPESNRIDLVWRGHLDADGTYASARLMHITESGQIERMKELVREQSTGAANEDEKGA